MWKFILNYINGALGISSIESGERISPEEERFPTDGIVRAPSFDSIPHKQEPLTGSVRPKELGEVVEVMVGVDYPIYGGQTILVADFGTYTIELPSPCSGIIEETLIKPGSLIGSETPLFRIRRPI
ncbi:hypothetical protein ACJJIQ_01380 [Microbulbifer sp. ANSA003]|uniref:hypothetical protein n=1 Tax=unclassified Microbulbifer TaxID=2619833 RepID=UPI0040398729